MTHSTPCDFIRSRTMLYLDGELSEHEVQTFLQHIQKCAECETRIEDETRAHDELRSVLEAPSAPTHLSERLAARLSREDQKGQRAWLPAWALPGFATMAAAAALTIFVQNYSSLGQSARAPLSAQSRAGIVSATQARTRGPQASRAQTARAAVGSHNGVSAVPVALPGRAEKGSASHQQLQAPRIQPPQFSASEISFKGRMTEHAPQNFPPSFMFNYSDGEASALIEVEFVNSYHLGRNALIKRTLNGHPVWIKERGQEHIIYTRGQNGISYAISSTLNLPALIEAVASSNMLR